MPDENATIREVRDLFDDLKEWLEKKLDNYRTAATCDERHTAINRELAFYRKLAYASLVGAVGAIFALLFFLLRGHIAF